MLWCQVQMQVVPGANHEGAKGDVMVPSVVCDDGEWVPATVKDGGASSMSESSDDPKLNAFKLLMDRRTDSPTGYRVLKLRSSASKNNKQRRTPTNKSSLKSTKPGGGLPWRSTL